VIARILVIFSLMLLVAAPASELAGTAAAAPAALLELADEPAPLADDDAVAPPAAAPDAWRARGARPAAGAAVPPAPRALTQIFRPPRPALG
jgi:hypothetical protein